MNEEMDNLGLPASDSDVVEVNFRIEAVTAFFLWGDETGEYITVDLTGGPSYPLMYEEELYAELCKELAYD